MPDRYGDEAPPHLDPQDIAHCELCDDDGYHGSVVCDHIDHSLAAKRGMYLIRQVLEGNQQHQEESTDE